MTRPSRSTSRILASMLLNNRAAWMIERSRAGLANMLSEKGVMGVNEWGWAGGLEGSLKGHLVQG